MTTCIAAAAAPACPRRAPRPVGAVAKFGARTAKPLRRRLDLEFIPAVRRLNERFGSDWRYEITEQQRDGDEAIVLGRLTFGKDGAVRTQFGRASDLSEPSRRREWRRAFQVGYRLPVPTNATAFRRAAEAALMNCVELI